MTQSKNIRTILGLCLALGAGAGCRDDAATTSPDEGGSEQAVTEDDTGDGADGMDAMGMAGAAAPALGTLECQPAPEGPAVCGGVTCADVSADQVLLCIVACCTADDTCGIQGRVDGQDATECMAELDAEADARCPDDAFVDGTEGIGCCTDDGMCGLIDPVFGLGCVERSEVYGVTLESQPCDDSAQE